jgi:hypothetical protein
VKVQTKHLHQTLSALAPFAEGPHPFVLVEDDTFVAMDSSSLAIAKIPITRPAPDYFQSLLIPTQSGELDLILKSLKAYKDPNVQIETATPGHFSLSCLPSTTFNYPAQSTFPPWRELLPTVQGCQQTLAISPILLGRSAKSAKCFDPKSENPFQVENYGAESPVVFSYKATWGGVLKILLMPTVSAKTV